MTARATNALVRAIIEVDSTITDLTPFINASHSLIEAQCEGIEEAEAIEVETWLAAHFVSIRDNRAYREQVGQVEIVYQYKLGLGLACSMYGQMAMNLDSTGGLARWNASVLKGNSGKTVGVTWVGTKVTESE